MDVEPLILFLGCTVLLGILLAIAWKRGGLKEGFQAGATKPAWLDTQLWTPLNRTRFGWMSATPSTWFQYDYVSLASIEPIYDADLAQDALNRNEQDPTKARADLKAKLMEYIVKANRAGTTPSEITPSIPPNMKASKIRLYPSDIPAIGVDPNDSAYFCLSQIIIKDETGTNVALQKPVSFTRPYPTTAGRSANIVDGTLTPRSGNYSFCLGRGEENMGAPDREADYVTVDLEGTFTIASISYIGRSDYTGPTAYAMQRNKGVRIKLLDNDENVLLTLRTSTTDTVQTISVDADKATSEGTRPANVFDTMWTPLHRVMWGIKDDAFDSVENDLVLNGGAQLSTADLTAITEKPTQRTFPADVAQRALNTYGQDPVRAREKLLNGTAFESGLSAYIEIADTIFREYGILIRIQNGPPDGISGNEWTPINRTMFPIVSSGVRWKTERTLSGTLRLVPIPSYRYNRYAGSIIPREKAQYMLSITADDPIEARYLYLKEREKYDAKYEENKKRKESDSVSNIKVKSCTELDSIYDMLEREKRDLRPLIQDMSGSAIVAAGAKDENMQFQKRFFQDCTGTTSASSGPCKDLATQDEGLFSLYREYEATNTDLFTREVEVTEAIKTVANTMKLLKCPQTRVASYSVEKDIGYIDSTSLYMKLSELSPYYVSPDIIKELANILNELTVTADSETVKDSAKIIKGRTENITTILRPYKV